MKRVLRRLCCPILILSLFPVVSPAPALAAEKNLAYGQLLATDLKALGLFAGVSDTDFALDRAPTRVEALVMLIRLMGVERQAVSGDWSHPFTDVPEWADRYVGYAYVHALTSGESAERFGTGDADAAVFLTFVLRALGHSDRGDGAEFSWNDPFSLARAVGILPQQANLSPFRRSDAVIVFYAALGASVDDSGKTLAERLIEQGAFTREQFDLCYHPEYLSDSESPIEWTALSELRTGCFCGYTAPNGSYDATRSTDCAAYGSIPAAAGTVIRFSPGSQALTGYELWQYDVDGNFVSRLGDIASCREELITTQDGYVTLYAQWIALPYPRQESAQAAAAQFQLCFPAQQQVLLSSLAQATRPFVFEVGFLTQGVPYSSNNCIRSADFLAVGAGSRLYHSDFGYRYTVLYYDANKEFITTSGWQYRSVYTIPYDCLIRVLVTPIPSKTIGDQELEAARRSISMELQPLSSEFDELPPGYYFTGDYLPRRLEKINAFSGAQDSSDQFIFMTDLHWASNAKRSPALMRRVAKDTGAKQVIFGGDAIDSFNTKSDAIRALREFRQPFSYFSDDQWLSVIGNHEFNNPSALPVSAAQLTESEVRNAYLGGQVNRVTTLTPYLSYRDNQAAKIRYFLLGLNYSSALPHTTVSAFLSALTEVPEGYAVVLVSHAGLNDKNEIDRSVKDIVGALDAVRDRSSYRYGGKTYRYSDLKNVTAVCVLSGHQHRDGAVITQTGLPVISTACDAWRAAASADEQTRVRGTITEQAFDVVQIDLNARRVLLTRIGAGEDREFSF